MIRLALVAAVLLNVPVASAMASGVHLSYSGQGEYFVTFSSPTPLPDPKVTWAGGSAVAQAWPHPTADNDSIYTARIPARALDHAIDGRTFHAQAPPASGAATRVAFVADWGRSADSYAVYDRIVASTPDVLIIGGDLSYANGRPRTWDEWLAHLEPDAAAREAFQPLLAAGRVDLALSGHVHAYERSRPIDGVVFVDSGGGGRSLYSQWGPSPSWSARRSAEFEFVLLDITPTKIDVRALRRDGTVLDAFTITKSGVQENATGGKSVPGAPAILGLAVGALAWLRRRGGAS